MTDSTLNAMARLGGQYAQRGVYPTPAHEIDDVDLHEEDRYDRMLAAEEAGCSDPQCEGC